MNDLSQLDELIESDVLEALGQEKTQAEQNSEEDEIKIEDFEESPFTQERENSNLEDTETTTNEDEITIEDFDDNLTTEVETEIENETPILDEIQQTVTTPEINTNDLATLLSQLLNNKTIEITIKIKD